MKKCMLILTVGVLFSCSKLVLLAPSQNDVSRVEQKFPGITIEDLSQGKVFFENNCNKCHSLKRPFKVSEKRLYEIVPVMAKKAKVDAKTEDLILKYLVTMNSVQKK